MEVTDDGFGWPAGPYNRGRRRRHGLIGLRERAEAAGGSLSVSSPAHGGFALTVGYDRAVRATGTGAARPAGARSPHLFNSCCPRGRFGQQLLKVAGIDRPIGAVGVTGAGGAGGTGPGGGGARVLRLLLGDQALVRGALAALLTQARPQVVPAVGARRGGGRGTADPAGRGPARRRNAGAGRHRRHRRPARRTARLPGAGGDHVRPAGRCRAVAPGSGFVVGRRPASSSTVRRSPRPAGGRSDARRRDAGRRPAP